MQYQKSLKTVSKKNNAFLSTMDRHCNQKIAANIIIVENYFGRETQLWSVLDEHFILSEAMYDTVMSVCRSLNNRHIKRHPLRDEDNVFFKQQQRRVYAQGMKRGMKKKAGANNYCRQRQRRLLNIGNSENGGGETTDLDEILY